jgi:hypothetical protein
MARQQYRVSGELSWQSNSGNALLALVNKNSSGKKVTIRSLEVNSLTSTSTATAGTVSAASATYLTLGRATVSGGDPLSLDPMDTDASSWPTTVSVVKQAAVASPTFIRRIAILKQMNQASLSWMGRQTPRRFGNAYAKPRKDSIVESVVIRAGEGVAIYASTFNNSVPLRVTATLIRVGTPNRVWTTTFFTSAIVQDVAIFAIDNAAGSGETVRLLDVAVEEVGTYDSPYLQLVPSGGLIDATVSQRLTAVRMDTDYADPATFVDIQADCPMFPYAMPENAFSDASGGSPKGFNYLKTKDFLGPVYRTMFPEMVRNRPTFMPDVFGVGQQMTDMLARKAGIVLREGEGIALVSAAETAAGATAAVGCSGWSSFEFAMTFDLEPIQIPTINISGMVVGSRWRIERVSDDSLVATGLTADGTGSFVYDLDDVPLNLRLRVRKASSAPFYKSYEVEFNLTTSGISIPVSQIADL